MAAMEGADPDEAVVMLNLLKYREVAEDGVGVDGMSGRDAYTMYRLGIRSTSSPFRGRSDMDRARPAQCDRSGGVGYRRRMALEYSSPTFHRPLGSR